MSNLRGWQGAGLIIGRNSGKTSFYKTTGNGIDLAHDREMNQDLFHSPHLGTPAFMIGHTRWPTKGAITLEATHPHKTADLIGVHNGTIDSMFGHAVGKDESDSALLYQNIQDKGLKETINNTYGAWALVWVDRRDQTLNFLRNNKRPLHLAYTKAGTMYWASEGGMLQFVLGRAGEQFEMTALKEDTHVCFELPLPQNMRKAKYYTQEIKGKTYTPVRGVTGTVPFLGVGTGATSGTETAGKAPAGLTNPKNELEVWCYRTNKWTTRDKAQLAPTPRLPARTTPALTPGGTTPSTSSGGSTPWEPSPTNKVSTDVAAPKTKDQASSSTSDQGGATFPVTDDEDDGQYVAETAAQSDIERLFPDHKVSDLYKKSKYDKGHFGTSNFSYRETAKGRWVSYPTYMKKLSDGCCWCGEPCDDLATHIWISEYDFFCHECRHDEGNCALVGSMYHINVEPLTRRPKDNKAA